MTRMFAKFAGYCTDCGSRIKVNDLISYQAKPFKRVLCKPCYSNPSAAPANGGFWAGQRGGKTTASAAAAGAPFGVKGLDWQAINASMPSSSPSQPPARQTLDSLMLAALVALEAAIIEAHVKRITPEAEEGWRKYQAIKALALKPGTKGEGDAAFKQALLQAVRLAF